MGPQHKLPNVPRLAGNWKPREKGLLLKALERDWNATTAVDMGPETTTLRRAAIAPSEIRQDDMLRPRTEVETEALLAYLNGNLELPHAPIFLKATMPLLQRAMIEQYHETHVETTLTADVSPRAKLRRNLTHHALFGLLYQANADSEKGREPIRRMMDDVKILHFDGVHTLKFVFHSSRLAQLYSGVAVRLQGQCIELEDSEANGHAGILRPAQLRRRYAFRVLHMENVGLVALLATLGQLTGLEIVDAERPRIDSTEVVDNRYVVIYLASHDCPSSLRGVTKIDIGGTLITVHHHLLQPRFPCARCYAPYHTSGYCKASTSLMDRLRTKHTRIYEGALPRVKVGDAVQYRHSEGDSLNHFLATLQDEIRVEMGTAASAVLGETPRPSHQQDQLLQSGRSPPAAAAPTTTSMGAGRATASPEVPPDSSDAGGYRVAQSRSLKAKTKATAKATRKQESTTNAPPTGQIGQASDNSRAQSAKNICKGRESRSATANRQGFASLNRERARGRFDELAGQDSDCESDDAGDSDYGDDAPYAYEGGEARSPDLTPAQQPALANPIAGATSKGPLGTNHMEIDSDAAYSISGYVGSSAPSQSASYGSTPGSEFPYTLASQTDATEEKSEDNPPCPQPTESGESLATMTMPPMAEAVSRADSGPLSLTEDGFVMEKTVYPAGMPQQLSTFLRPFGGTLVGVPSNGQCAYTALYASTSYIEGGVLQFTSEVVRNNNISKRSVYTLMMTNLAKDVECGVVDPRRELKRLYPLQTAPTDVAAATATLDAHYAQERARSVNTQIPSDFWAGAEVLRAMAQYLREPLFVFDVDNNDHAHVQRYYYKNYDTPSGKTHETGCGGAIDDATALKLLRHHARLHVLPVMLVIKRHEGHFYGVHHGDIAVRWLAEGDRNFAEANCTTHPWYDEVVAHIESSSIRVQTVDKMDSSPVVNEIIIGGMEHRDRLDIVHDRVGLPRLNGDAYDIEDLECKLSAEGDRLQKAAGPHHGLQADGGISQGPSMPAGRMHRYPIATQGRVALLPLQRILDSINLEPEHVSDRSKLRHLLRANAEAVEAWCTQGAPGPDKGSNRPRGLAGLLPWLLQHRDELHSLFSFLPYPEIAAKQIPLKMLRHWGRMEAYDTMVAAIRGVLQDATASLAAVDHCKSWLAACTMHGGDSQDRNVAGERHRWVRLRQLYPKAPAGACPENIPVGCWEVLHTLPHTLWAWGATAMGGGRPRTAVGARVCWTADCSTPLRED